MRIPSCLRPSVLAVIALALVASASAGDLPSAAPSPGAKPHTWHETTSAGGVRYAWLVPKGYDGQTKRNLTAILHGTGLDYRWGPANHPAGVFRPDDVVVSLDGPSPGQDGTRLFLGEKKDADACAAFLTEMRAAFAVDRVFLYGHSQGGFFVVYFAGEHPEAVAGVVAHAAGAWNWSKTTGAVKKVAIAFQHGTLDPVVPYGQSPVARDAYAAAGFELLHLRRLDRYNHWPNAVRSAESLDWCEGMTTTDPERALELARRILAPKKSDEYSWETVVGYSGARDVLRRLEKKGPAPFAEVPEKTAAAAAALVTRVEAEGAKHVSALEKSVKARKDLTLKSGGAIGHVVPLREDFRGVDSVEEYVKKIGFDAELASQKKAVGAIVDAWYGSSPPRSMYETILGNLADACLYEGFPSELAQRLDEWKSGAKSLGIDAKSLKKHPDVDAWRDAWKSGAESYKAIWKTWKLP